MNTIQISVRAFAITWIFTFLAACGSSQNASDQSSEAGVQSPEAALTEASDKLSAVLSEAGVISIGQGNNMGNGAQGVSGIPNLPADCTILSGDAASLDPSTFFPDLQSQVEEILQDVENQDVSQLSERVQDIQAKFMAGINDLLGEIQKCIPADGTPAAGGVNLPDIGALTNMNIPQPGSFTNVNLPQFGSLPNGLNFPQTTLSMKKKK